MTPMPISARRRCTCGGGGGWAPCLCSKKATPREEDKDNLFRTVQREDGEGVVCDSFSFEVLELVAWQYDS